jgi:ATP-dependent DNA helicase RecQ
MVRTGQRFGAGHVVDVVTGADTQKIRDFGHDRVKTYGAGKDKPKRTWRAVVDNLIAQECVRMSDGRYPTLQLTKKGFEVLFGREAFYVLRQREPAGRRRERRPQRDGAAGPLEYDEALFQELRTVRRRLARERSVPPYVIFSDRTLHEMAAYAPATEAELRGITGVGDRKLELYGKAFLAAIRAFAGGNAETADGSAEAPPSEPKTQPREARKGRSLEATWLLAREGLSYVEIAEKRRLTPATVAGHIEKLILAGRDIDPDVHVGAGKRIEIERLFETLRTRSLRRVVDASKGTVTHAEVRIVRAYLQEGGQQE